MKCCLRARHLLKLADGPNQRFYMPLAVLPLVLCMCSRASQWAATPSVNIRWKFYLVGHHSSSYDSSSSRHFLIRTFLVDVPWNVFDATRRSPAAPAPLHCGQNRPASATRSKKYVFETNNFITLFVKENVHSTYLVHRCAQNSASFYAAWLQT